MMKSMLVILATLGSAFIVSEMVLIGNKTKPKKGDGAMVTFKSHVKLHKFFIMENSQNLTQGYLTLLEKMGAIEKVNGKYRSEHIPSETYFGYSKDDQGYYPVISLKGKFPKWFHKVYLLPREEMLGVIDSAIAADKAKVIPNNLKKEELLSSEKAIFEQEYPLKDFPKTLRIGAGDGGFARDAYYVRVLQDALFDQGYQVSTDGVFDQAVKNAVVDFQKKKHLNPDGIVGEDTQKALNLGKFREITEGENAVTIPLFESFKAFFLSEN